MRSNIKVWGMLILMLWGCSKKTVPSASKKAYRNIDNLEFHDLKGKAKIHFNNAGKKISGNALFRIKKDSVIWLSISPGLGIEVARVLITTDSIHVLDKLRKDYYAYSFCELLPEYECLLNYQYLQSLLVGESLFPTKANKLKKDRNFLVQEKRTKSLQIKNHIGTKSKRLEKISISDLKSSTVIQMNYSNFSTEDNISLPLNIDAELNRFSKEEKSDSDEMNLQIRYSKITSETNTLTFPFKISEQYDRK